MVGDNTLTSVVYDAPVGRLFLVADSAGLRSIRFREDNFSSRPLLSDQKAGGQNPRAVLKQAMTALDSFFEGKWQALSFPYQVSGTDFQKSVWRAISLIPYGEVASYSDIARMIGRPRAHRAVANACGANQLPILIPCHRVVAANGIGGYSSGLAIKRWLLNHEGFDVSQFS